MMEKIPQACEDPTAPHVLDQNKYNALEKMSRSNDQTTHSSAYIRMSVVPPQSQVLPAPDITQFSSVTAPGGLIYNGEEE